MSFLYGQTTAGAWPDKFVDLISGATPDDQGTTCALADRWRARYGASPSYLCIAPPASQDELVTQEHRQGYWGRYDDCCIYTDGAASGMDYMRQKTIWTSWPTSFREWAIITVRVLTANTTAGNYSTASLRLYAVSFDKAGVQTSNATNVVVTPAADGTCTYTYTGGTMTFQIGNSVTGKVTKDSFYVRAFSAQFPGGVDWWRRSARNVDSAYEFTAGAAPSGTLGVDYAVNIGPMHQTCGNPPTPTQNVYNYMAGMSQTTGSSVQSTASNGLAIMTNAALTGSRYEVSFSKAEGVCSVVISGTTTTYFALQFGGVGQSADASLITGVEGESTTSALSSSLYFLKYYPPNTSSIIQYWISVTATHIGVVINAETTSGWSISGNLYAKVVQDDPSYGQCWMRGFTGGTRQWTRNGSSAIIERALYQGKGFHDGGRDWQTGQGRHDITPLIYYGNWNAGGCGSAMFSSSYDTLWVLNHGSTSSTGGLPIVPWTINAAGMPISDSRWRLAGFSLMDGTSPTATDTSIGSVGQWKFRGYVSEGVYQTPSGTFNHGDELTDTVTGDKYLLWNTGIDMFPSYGPEAAGTYPGFVLEEK